MKKIWIGLIIGFLAGAILFSGNSKVEKTEKCKYNEEDVKELLSIDNEVFQYAGDIIDIFSTAVFSTEVSEIETATQEINKINGKLEIKRDQRMKLLEEMGF